MKPIEYNITPAKGQALLNFQGRRLPERITLFETELIEKVRASKNGQLTLNTDATTLNKDFKNLVIHGDALSACAYLKDKDIKVDLVYIDPPFASGANYAIKIYLRNGNKTEFENSNAIGEEVMYGDIWQKEDYLNWLYERLLAIKEVMSETASIYVHLDWHIGHYAKILLDEIFGEENFVNEIIWAYHGPGSPGMKQFNRKHDTIFWYSKHDDWIFNDDDIRVTSEVHEGGFNGEMDKNVSEGYTNKGKIPEDWWEFAVSSRFKVDGLKRVDYATEKPFKLIKRIIKASSNRGMIVADFFGGSGVTAKVANDLGRKFITGDVGINAIQTMRDRLVKAKADFNILNVQDGIRLFRNPAQTQTKIFSLIDGFAPNSELELNPFWDGGIMSKRGTYVPVKFIGLNKKLTKEQVDFIIQQVISLEDKEQEEIKVESEKWINKIPACKIIFAYKDVDIDQKYVNKSVKFAKKTSIKVELLSLVTFAF